ncbi:MAG: CvpA family protein [Saprospiraceae bacterium]|nr:CvpA family protein [Saprospiraceae bacterium]
MFIDLVAVLLIAFGFYQGFTRGLIKTVFATLSVIIALVAALKLSPLAIGLLQNTIPINPALNFVIGFVLTFILVMALIRFIGNKLDKLMKSIHIGGVNKILGGGLLGLFYAILISYGLYFMDRIELVGPAQKESSYTYPILKTLPSATQKAGESLKPVFKEFWDAMLETMDAIKTKSASNDEGTSN